MGFDSILPPAHSRRVRLWAGALLAAFAAFALPAAADMPVNSPTFMDAPVPVADEVLVLKSERRLYLMKDGDVLKGFDVQLGLSPEGHKQREGDARTPEGRYYLNGRNRNSDFFLSIRITYPNEEDRRRAERNGHNPGGSIMIHGLPNERRYPEHYYRGQDWTDGCIAVSDADMIDIWLMTRDNTPITIRP